MAAVAVAAVAASAAAAAPGPRQPTQRHTAADMRRASALALRRSDLAAGWKADPPAAHDPPCSAGPDESKLVQTAHVDPTFTWKDGVTTVGSEVDIFRSEAEALQDWRSSTLALMKACLLQSARAGAGKGVGVSIVSARRLAAPQGVARALHYRLVFALTGKRAVQLVADVVALGRGRTTVVLHALSVAAPLPASAVSDLAGLLGTRLNAGHGQI